MFRVKCLFFSCMAIARLYVFDFIAICYLHFLYYCFGLRNESMIYEPSFLFVCWIEHTRFEHRNKTVNDFTNCHKNIFINGQYQGIIIV